MHLQFLVVIITASWIVHRVVHVDAFCVFHPPSKLMHITTTGTSTTIGTSTSTTTTQLFLAVDPRRTKKKKKDKNKKKYSNNNVITKNKSKDKRNRAASDTTTHMSWTKSKSSSSNNNNENKEKDRDTTTGTSKKKGRRAPPWQTISTKDMTKNINAEKNRRRIAQETGQHVTAQLELEATQLSYQRSSSFLSPQDKLLMSWKPFRLNPNQQEIIQQGAYLNKILPPRMGVPEICFIGRSNSGKSSLLNRLVGKSDLARVGKTPGATAAVNLYQIQQQQHKNKGQQAQGKPLLGLVDLPGFGYAKNINKGTQQSIQETAEKYLAERKELALGILLVDSRRIPTRDDKAVLAALFDLGVPLMVVATKVDKFSTQEQVDVALTTIQQELGLPDGQPLCISSVTGQGIKGLWKIVLEACEGHVEELTHGIEQGDNNNKNENNQETHDDDDFDDDDYYDDDDSAVDSVYSQGYDWIQGSVMYEGEKGDQYYEEDETNDSNTNNNSDDDEEGFTTATSFQKKNRNRNSRDGNNDDNNDDVISENNNNNKKRDHKNNNNIPPQQQKETLKYLRKKAKKMEKRGEFY